MANLPQTFSEHRLFIRTHESEFFLDRFWNDFEFRCRLRNPRLTTDFTPDFIDGVCASQVVAHKGASVSYRAVRQNDGSGVELNRLFCERNETFSLSDNHKLRLKLHKDSLFLQDVSEKSQIAVVLRPGMRGVVETGIVFGIGVRQQHKVRVVSATPFARPPAYPSTNDIFLNPYNPTAMFADAVSNGRVTDVQSMNDFTFRNVRPQKSQTSCIPTVQLEFISGPKVGLTCQFQAVEDLANRDKPHFKIGISKDSDIFLEDLDVCHFNLSFHFDSRIGWRAASSGPSARAFMYLKSASQIEDSKHSFHQLLAFNADLVTNSGIWTFEKQVTLPDKLPVAPHRAAAAPSADVSPNLLLFQFTSR